MSRRRHRDQQGSLTVELVVMVPLLFMLAVAILAFGRVSEARQQVVEASSAGAESAAVLPDAASAQSGAAASAAAAVSGTGHTCAHAQVAADVSQFRPGGFVSVTVVCQVDLSDLPVPGLPDIATVRATSAAPIDPYRSVR